jgi:hypothetical protein
MEKAVQRVFPPALSGLADAEGNARVSAFNSRRKAEQEQLKAELDEFAIIPSNDVCTV